MPHSTRAPIVALIASSVLWGLIWLPLKYFSNMGFGSVALLFVAYCSLTVIGLPLLIKHARHWHKEWSVIALIFVFGGYANIAFNTSMMYGNVIRTMALFYTLPLWALLGAYFFLSEKVTLWRAVAASFAMIGAWLILGGINILASPPGWMDLLALTSGFTYAMNNLCFRATPAIPVAPKIATMFLSGAVFSALLLLAGVEALPRHLSPSLWVLASAFGLVWILLANMGTQWGVTHIEAGRAAVIIVLELVIAIISSMLLSDARLSLLEWCGAGLILIAALMEARDQPT